MKAKRLDTRVISYGPGGYKCSCCGPSPKRRPQERKRRRRVFSRLIDKIERLEANSVD